LKRNSLPSLCVLFCFASAAWATPLTFSTPITVNGTDVFSGPSFVVAGNFGDTDTLSLRADGLVDLASGSFTANAAGVIVSPATTNTGAHPGDVTLSAGFPYAALLLGNGSLGFFPVFPADAAAGFGSPTPPSFVEISNRSLGAIFGSGVMISNGSVLEFRINDINTGDNGGFYELTQSDIAAVPEPATGISFVLGLAAAAVFLRRRVA
jgi:PEP-CTERM motif